MPNVNDMFVRLATNSEKTADDRVKTLTTIVERINAKKLELDLIGPALENVSENILEFAALTMDDVSELKVFKFIVDLYETRGLLFHVKNEGILDVLDGIDKPKPNFTHYLKSKGVVSGIEKHEKRIRELEAQKIAFIREETALIKAGNQEAVAALESLAGPQAKARAEARAKAQEAQSTPARTTASTSSTSSKPQAPRTQATTSSTTRQATPVTPASAPAKTDKAPKPKKRFLFFGKRQDEGAASASASVKSAYY